MTERMVRVGLELDPDADPVRGRIRWPGGQAEFVGWLEFSELIDRMQRGGEPEDGGHTPTFATRDLRKDVALALGQADECGVELPVARRMIELLDDAIGRGLGDLDFLALVPRLQAASGLPTDVAP